MYSSRSDNIFLGWVAGRRILAAIYEEFLIAAHLVLDQLQRALKRQAARATEALKPQHSVGMPVLTHTSMRSRKGHTPTRRVTRETGGKIYLQSRQIMYKISPIEDVNHNYRRRLHHDVHIEALFG